MRAPRLLSALIAFSLFSTGLIAATAGTAYACSCLGETNLGSIESDQLIVAARVVAVDGDFPEPDGTIDYTLEVVLDPNDSFDTDTVEVTSADNSASCGVEWADGDLIGITLYEDDGAFAAGLCDRVAPEIVEIYDEYKRAGDDPTDYCFSLITDLVVPLEEALVIRSACDGAESATGNTFFVFIDDVYFSRPLDALVSVEVAALAPPLSVTPVPTTLATPRPTATPTPRPTIPAAPTATPRAIAAAPVVTTFVVAQPTAVIQTTAANAASFGWSPTATSAQHAATVTKTGAAVVHVGFTG